MRRVRILIGGLLGLCPAAAETMDRIAVTVGRTVITESEIVSQIRIAALLDGVEPDLGPAARRRAGERLVERALIRREMQLSRYPTPGQAEAQQELERIRRERFPEDSAYRSLLARHRTGEEELKLYLLELLTTLRFIEYRFRPAIANSGAELEQYYRGKLRPQWAKNGSGEPPSLEDSIEEIDRILTQEKIDRALEAWLDQSRRQTRVEFREEAFR